MESYGKVNFTFMPIPFPSPPALSTLSLLKTRSPTPRVCLLGPWLFPDDLFILSGPVETRVMSSAQGVHAETQQSRGKYITVNYIRPTMGCPKTHTPVEREDSKEPHPKGSHANEVSELLNACTCGLVFLFMQGYSGQRKETVFFAQA